MRLEKTQLKPTVNRHQDKAATPKNHPKTPKKTRTKAGWVSDGAQSRAGS